jgi:NAD(P)H-flavin reductase
MTKEEEVKLKLAVDNVFDIKWKHIFPNSHVYILEKIIKGSKTELFLCGDNKFLSTVVEIFKDMIIIDEKSFKKISINIITTDEKLPDEFLFSHNNISVKVCHNGLVVKKSQIYSFVFNDQNMVRCHSSDKEHFNVRL